MTEHTPDQHGIVDELKQLGYQLTATLKAVATSDQVRALGHELKDGLRDAAQNVEGAWDTVRERDDIQRLQARAAEVAGSFKSGVEHYEIREELGAALHALNVRLAQLLERVQQTPHGTALVGPVDEAELVSTADEPSTGTTQRLEY